MARHGSACTGNGVSLKLPRKVTKTAAKHRHDDVKDAVLCMTHLGAGSHVRVDVLALTRKIEFWRDFRGEACPVHGPYPGCARVLFYSDTTTRLALKAGAGLCKRRLNVHTAKSMLLTAVDILAEVWVTIVANGLTERDLIIAVTDSHQHGNDGQVPTTGTAVPWSVCVRKVSQRHDARVRSSGRWPPC